MFSALSRNPEPIRGVRRERKKQPVNRDYSVVKLHSVKSANVVEEKRIEFDEKIARAKAELARLQTDELGSNFLISKQKKIIEKLVKDSKQDHHTAYLLDAIPILNDLHRNSRDLSDKPEDEKLLKERSLIVSEYIRRFFPDLLSKRKSTEVLRIESVSNIRSTCCGAKKIQVPEGAIVCGECGVVLKHNEVNLSHPSKNLSYTRSISPAAVFSYKRLNHLRELLRQVQGKTSNVVDPITMKAIKKEMSKSTLPIELVRARHVKKVLKKLKLHKLYENVVSITKLINPKFEPIKMEPAYEEQLVLQFVQLEKPFERIRPLVDKKRKNFSSYPFCLYRLNQLNGREDLNRDLKLLKSVTLINRQDKFWKALMREVGWKYLGNTIT
jgi:hypothetical protein